MPSKELSPSYQKRVCKASVRDITVRAFYTINTAYLLVLTKEESEKVGLKLNIQKTKIMASSPITSWEIDGGTVETVSDFIFLGSKITADGDRMWAPLQAKPRNPIWKRTWQKSSRFSSG